jgi:hypothetical protein
MKQDVCFSMVETKLEINKSQPQSTVQHDVLSWGDQKTKL